MNIARLSGKAAGRQVIAYNLHGNCYLNLTNRCTLRCRFCPKFNRQWDVQSYNLRLHTEPDIKKVLSVIKDIKKYNEVVFCGLGEPSLRLDDVLNIATQIKRVGGRTRLNTDGLINWVLNQDITPRFKGLIDSLSISLNAQNESVYMQHCRPPAPGAYRGLRDFIDKARAYVPHITLTAIAGLDGVDINACRNIADKYSVQFRQRQLDKVG